MRLLEQPVREPEAACSEPGGERHERQGWSSFARVTEERRHGEEAPDDGADRQHGEGHGHHRRRFVEVVRGLGRHARFPEEGQADEPPRVVGGERRRDEADDAEDGPRVRASERAV